jgi:hypothetical protein
VLLTTIPNEFATPLLTQQVARAVGLPLVLAPLDGLSTFDNIHLDAPSAERWSALFLKNAEPQIETCMATVPARANAD